MENNDSKMSSEHVSSDEINILLTTYQLADNQLQMRIQQRDNFAIQLMVALGVIIGVISSSENLTYMKLGLLLIPIICSYFCSQILSSYEVHHRLAYYMKTVIEKALENNISNNLVMWENFCHYDRKVIIKSKIGGRESFFKMINLLVALIAFLANVLIIAYPKPQFKWYDYVIFSINFLLIFWAFRINKRYSSKESYETVMNNRVALRGYINTRRSDYTLSKKAVFLDRDGTIIVDKVETRRIEDLEFFNDIDCLKALQDAGFLLIIVTNQSGIGKGNYSVEEMQTFNDYMISKLADRKIQIDALYYCPHTAQSNCLCKKPRDGMIRRANIDFNLDLRNSYIIGDQNSDIMAGINADLKGCFVVPTGLYPKNSTGKYEVDPVISDKTIVCNNLQDAANKILANEFSVNDD